MRCFKNPFRSELSRVRGRSVALAVIAATSQIAAVCTPPQTPKVAYLAHAEDLVELAEWLRWQAPAPSLSLVQTPIVPFASLPLSSGDSETTLESTVTVLGHADCSASQCIGSLSASGPHSSGFEQFEVEGSWTVDGTVLSAHGSARQNDGLAQARWTYDGTTLRTYWTLPYAHSITGVVTEATTELTVATRTTGAQQCRMLGRDGQTVALCTRDGIHYTAEATVDLTWPTAVAETWLSDGSALSTYPDGSTAWTRPLLPGAAVTEGHTVFGAYTTLQARSVEEMRVQWTYSRCDIYHSQADWQYGLPSTDAHALWTVERQIVSYNGITHHLFSELRPGSREAGNDSMRATVRVNLPGATREGETLPFEATGAFSYGRDLSGWFGLWRGSLQTEYGDALLVEMRRDPVGRWSVSGTYDDADTPDQYPDEEMSLQMRLDGSGDAIAFKLRALDSEDQGGTDIGDTAIERIEIPFVFAQPGARLTARPADCD